MRLDQLLGKRASSGFMIRSASRLMAADDSSHERGIAILGPEAHIVHNSGIPYSLNDGPMWAGRGWNEDLTAGLVVRDGSVKLIIAPTFVTEANEAFQVIQYNQNLVPQRSEWANPFHPLPESIDLPLRFGDQPIHHLDPGQTSLTVNERNVAFGLGSENLWWGPGIRNAITLSNNAAGFAHAFVQTRQPARTRFGTFDAQWVLGQLSESGFFDLDPHDDTRAVNGLALAWNPPGDSDLTVGAARLVIANLGQDSFVGAHVFDFLRPVGHPFTDTTNVSGRDQITSLFGRWVFPSAGFEAYVEWARFEEPVSLRDLLEYPEHSEGYTLGVQWARALSSGRTFQLQGEASYLEPDPSLRLRPVATTYTSRDVPQGFTQAGQSLGAAIGPGSSSQWLAGDVFAHSWRLGAYLSRIRWDNGVLFEPIVPFYKRQDVSLIAGLRGSFTWRGVSALIDFAHTGRFNYLYQSYILGPNRFGGIDLINNTLSLTLSTAVSRR